MNTVTKTAFANLKQDKVRNILTGIAIALTTILIYTILTIGFGTIKLQKEAINRIYPTWHMMYRDVSYNNTQALKKNVSIDELGERSDIAEAQIQDSTILLIYMDDAGYKLNKIGLLEGSQPKKADEIAVSKAALKAAGLTGSIGDYIELPYQFYKSGGLGDEKQGKFKICGILADGETNPQKKIYAMFVSAAFMNENVPALEQSYRIMLRIAAADRMTSEQIEAQGKKIAADFGVEEGNIVFNNEYLWANYIDPAFYTGIAFIVLIVIFAGFLTIYGIYYVSMIHKVQEYGKLKALGATKRQIRQMVFREGMFVSGIFIPLGLFVGIAVSRSCFLFFTKSINSTNSLSKEIIKLLKDGKATLFQPWIIAAAVGISLITVILSLLKPMITAGRISAIEAMRYEEDTKSRRKVRTGYTDLNLMRLTKSNLSRNKKRTAMTIITLGFTGILFIIIATVLSCANPAELAREEILGDYRISIDSESGNEMHPERDWKNIQQNNPLNNEFEEQLRNTAGIKKIYKMQNASILLKDYVYGGEPWVDNITGCGEEFADLLKDGEIEGSVSYKDLLKGDKIVLSKRFLHWFPDTKAGDKVNITIVNGNALINREFIIGAIGDYDYSFTKGACFILPTKVLEDICSYNLIYYLDITVDKNNEKVKADLQALTDSHEYLSMESYEAQKAYWKNTISMMSKAGYAFILILAGVGVMNLINTMINSVYTRKRELGIMQAIGMSDRQLVRMLQMEGLFYTAGTLVVSLGLGNLAGYGVFLYVKATDGLNITRYHFPLTQTVLLAAAVFAIQMLLSVLISRSFNRQSLIDRVRFSE